MQSLFNKEKRVLWLSFGGALLFAAVEIAFAVLSHSRSVLMDAAYDITEVLATLFMLVLTPYLYSAPTEKRPYGFAQAESLFVLFKGLLMLMINGGLAINTLRMALAGGNAVNGVQVSAFEVVLGLLGAAFFLAVRRAGRGLSSSLLDTVYYGWKLNVFYSGGMAAAFLVSALLKQTKLAFIIPYFDPVVAIVAFAFLLPDALRLLWRAIRSIFLFAPEAEQCDRLKALCEPQLEQRGLQALHYDIISTGRKLWVSVYFTAAESKVSLPMLNELNCLLNDILRQELGECYAELIPALQQIKPETVPDSRKMS